MPGQDEQLVTDALDLLKVQGLNFGYECIRNSAVRADYIRKTKDLSDSILDSYKAGLVSAEEGAKLANESRNMILEAARAKQTPLGRAYSTSLKKQGKALADLLEAGALAKFNKKLSLLTELEREQVLVGVMESAGRSRPAENARVVKLRWAGRAFWVFTLAVAAYNIGSAEDKVWAAGRETATLGGGFGGGAAGGAIAGIWFGPVGIAVGVAIGGIFGALVGDELFVGIVGPERDAAKAILAQYTSVFYTDEAGIAKALLDRADINMDEVYIVFVELADNYNGDADDVAYEYVGLVKQKGGAVLQALRLHETLRNLLIRLLDEGWTTDAEHQTIAYLKQLGTQ